MQRFFLVYFLLLSFFCFGQPQFEWGKTLGSNMSDKALSIEIDSQGNSYILGSFGEYVSGVTPLPFDLDPGIGTTFQTPLQYKNMFLVKLDASGSFVWGKVFGEIGYSDGFGISISVLGNIHISGVFSDTIDFGSGSGVGVLSALPSAYYSSFILKLDNFGDFIWVKSFENIKPAEIVVDENENVYTTGLFFDSMADFDPGVNVFNLPIDIDDIGTNCFVQKLDSLGGFKWAKVIGNKDVDMGLGIDVNMNENVVVTGYKSLDTIGGIWWPNPMPSCNNATFIEMFDSLGNSLWHHSFNSYCSDKGNDIKLDSDGKVYVTGQFLGPLNFSPAIGIPYDDSTIFGGVFVAKLNHDGDFEWFRILGDTTGFGVNAFGQELVVDHDKNVYISGFTSDTIDFDILEPNDPLINGGFLLKLNALGDIVWVVENPLVQDMEVSPQGDIYTVGDFYSSAVDLDPTMGVFNTVAQGSFDAFIQKLSQCSSSSVVTVTECGNYYWLAKDSMYSTSTIDFVELINSNGCDSLLWLDLTINDLDTSSIFTDVVSVCDNFYWVVNDSLYTQSVFTSIILPNSSGCDSIASLDLTINTINSNLTLSGITFTALDSNASYQWIDCDEDQAVPGETSQSFIPYKNGNYALVIVSSDGCSDTSECYNVSSMAVSKPHKNTGYSLFPNPTHQTVHISLGGDIIETLAICDVSGKNIEVINDIGQSNFIYRFNLPAGIYYFEVFSYQKKKTFKVLKL